MEMESGKLFIGGISWDTDEERLREYFQTFGEVVEAVIMKDRATGRARGFGFIVFADPAVAERVVREKHVIDGRTVEAKKAVPREDQHVPSRNNSSIQWSPGPSRTKKIFVGGLPSTVTESDFKKYFDQFGIITDVVVMYDHNTQRPRGFGFITYDSEEAVDKVLFKTFHELNGKLVEVKRAVPKEISPGPTRSQLSGYNYGLSRVNSFLNAYTQGYNPNPMGGYGVQIDGRYSPVTVGRSGYASFSPSNYGVGLNFEQGLSSNYAGTGSFGSDLDYGRAVNPLYNGGSNRYGINVANRYGINVGHGMGSGGSGSVLSSTGRSMWGGNPSTNSTSNDLLGSGGGNSGLFGAFGNSGTIWGASSNSGQNGGNNSVLSSGNFNYGRAETSFDPSVGGPRRNSWSGVAPKLSNATTEGNDGFYGNFHGGGSIYRDSSWQSSSPDPEGPGSFGYGPGSFGYGLGNAARDISPKDSVGYVGGYGVASRSNRGIAA